jgi:hypothetical protein
VADNAARAGSSIGDAAAQSILADRFLDGSELPDPPVSTLFTTDPKKWQRDPLNADPNVALGANWPHVRPFVMKKAEDFRPPPPPTYNSTDQAIKDRYVAAFNDVLAKGGDAHAGEADPPGNADRRPTPTTRTEDEEFIGKFWAYDATALLCAPPRLYNMIATSLALQEKRADFPDALTLARYLALVNVAMADAGISSWEAKYYYLYPRPVTAIRAATPANSPITQALPFWAPLGAPVSNARPGRVNFTPPFPSYTSGHAVFGGAVFQVFRRFNNWGDGIPFTFVSDEFNGLNRDAGAAEPRPRRPANFATFTAAETANARSRIFLGIHWQFDADEGVKQGSQIANYVFDNLYESVNP